MSATRVELDPQRVGDAQLVPFDFSSKMQVSQVISSAVFTVTVWSGNDPSPNNLLSATVTIVGNVVELVKAANQGVAGTIYLIKVTATLTGGVGPTIILEGLLAVLPEGI